MHSLAPSCDLFRLRSALISWSGVFSISCMVPRAEERTYSIRVISDPESDDGLEFRWVSFLDKKVRMELGMIFFLLSRFFFAVADLKEVCGV